MGSINLPSNTNSTQNKLSQVRLSVNNVSGEAKDASKKIDNDVMPRPTKYLNYNTTRAGIPETFKTQSGETPPSATVPILAVDEG